MKMRLYVMFIERSKSYNKMTMDVVKRHVERLKKLDDDGRMELCGAFKGYPGVAGMVILRAESRDEAEGLCKAEPLAMEGYATYKLRDFEVANKDNGYLL